MVDLFYRKMVGLLHALIDAKQHGSLLTAISIEFVLNEGIPLVIAVGLIIVVMIPLVFQPDLTRHRTTKARQFPGGDLGVERNGKQTQGSCHLEDQ